MRRFLLLLIAVTLPANAQSPQSLQLASSSNASLGQVSFNDGAHRYEFRLHGIAAATGGASNWVTPNCFIRKGLTLGCFDSVDAGPGGIPEIDLTGRTDVRVRFQRDPANSLQELEVWNGDGTGYTSNIVKVGLGPSSGPSGANTWPLGQGGVSIAFLRHYSGVVPTQGTIPVDFVSSPADLMDFELNGSLTDSSGKHNTITVSGAAYVASPTYLPHPSIGGSASAFVVRTGIPVTLDGSGSFSSVAALPTLTWQQLSGPAVGFIQAAGPSAAVFTAPVAGTYIVQLGASDGTGTNTTSVTIGAVSTDRNSLVVTANPNLDVALGPLTESGTNPWPWYDITERGVADALAPFQSTAPTGSPALSGTVTPAGLCCQVAIVGTGTHFTTDLQPNGLVWLWWDATGPGSGTGRYLTGVTAVIDDTHFTISDYTFNRPLSASTNIHYSTPTQSFTGTSVDNWTRLSQPSNSWNYYDNILGLYRLYYRTGQQKYLDQARTFCGLWWVYGVDYGYANVVPRNAGILGLIACAVDQHPEYWPGLVNYLSNNVYGSINPTSPIPLETFLLTTDVRENAYLLRSTALTAMLHPDPAVRANFCTYTSNAVRNLWLPNQDALGYWPEDLYAYNPAYPAKDINGRFGTSPWRTVGLASLALQRAYRALANPAGCNQPVLAASVLTSLESAGSFVWNYGRSADGGELYDVFYETLSTTGNFFYTDSSVGVRQGSTAVTGTGTQFLSRFAPCDGTTYIGIYSDTPALRKTYQVQSCTDDTHITLAAPYPNPTDTVTIWGKAVRAQTNCAPSLASYCEPDGFNGRNLAADGVAVEGWLYATTKNPQWLTWAQFFAGKLYGGPAGGPGTVGPPSGPNADGGTNNFTDPLPPCGSSPCGGYGPAIAQGKAFGFNAGAGDAPNGFAYLQGGTPQHKLRPMSVGLNLASFAAGTVARVTVVQPSGQSSQTLCSVSPCVITVDGELGDHLVTIDYLSSSGQVVNPGKPTIYKVVPD